MSDWLGLDGARVLVAGAGSIGAELVRGFAAAGARVAVGDVDGERLAQLDATTFEVDVRSPEACRDFVKGASDALGGLDVFVHCVGINDRRPIEDYGDEDWESMLAVNLSSAFWLAQAAVAEMRGQASGRVIFFSSVAGQLGHRHHGPYAATKGGINQLMKVMANELAHEGITVNAIAPGYVETELTREHLAKPGVRDKLLSLIPAGRFGTTAELVGPVLFLASRQAGFVTGHVLYVDGGRTTV
ncbi:MAG TPA: SDR family oxidoreductase [Thermoleophilaceae bacterium]|jgi:NAD(P)-dependent dehydrogenase (short-subunit alcohol dehydrogenase family)